MNKTYDVSMAQEMVGQTDENGKPKVRWVNLGIAFEKEGKPPRIKLNCLPIPNKEGEIWISLFEQKPKENGSGGNDYAQQKNGNGWG